jgi:hypothetical protein
MERRLRSGTQIFDESGNPEHQERQDKQPDHAHPSIIAVDIPLISIIMHSLSELAAR